LLDRWRDSLVVRRENSRATTWKPASVTAIRAGWAWNGAATATPKLTATRSKPITGSALRTTFVPSPAANWYHSQYWASSAAAKAR